MSVWRKAILEGEELLNNPERLEKEGTVRGRDIRPAASKVRSLHQNERLAKETIEGLQNHEPAPGAEKRQTVAVGEEDIIWEALRNASQFRAEKETQEPELRLVQHSTLDEY